jgi:hypothetical protein
MAHGFTSASFVKSWSMGMRFPQLQSAYRILMLVPAAQVIVASRPQSHRTHSALWSPPGFPMSKPIIPRLYQVRSQPKHNRRDAVGLGPYAED